MKKIFPWAAVIALLVGIVPTATRAQEKPTIVKTNVPKSAVCFICSQSGEEHGEERVAGAVAYKGKTYYFCAKKEVEEFVKDPDSFLPAPVPRPAPAFTLKNVSGSAVTLAELAKDKVLLIDFWATWCGPCVKAMPELQKLHEKYATGGKFSVVGISIDEEGTKKVQPFLTRSKTRFTYPILLDTGEKPVWQEWGVRAVPSVLLVKEGQIIRHWSGKINVKEVEKAVNEALAP